MLGRIAMVAGAAVGLAVAAATGGAQTSDTTLHVRGLKDPQLAEALGVFPGGGMFYAGEWKEGLRAYFGTVAGIGGGGMTIAIGELQGCAPLDFTCRPHRSVWPTRIVGGAIVASGIAFWGYEAVSAGRMVRRNNAKKIAAARDSAHATSPGDVRGFVAPGPTPRTLTLGVHATW